MVVNVTFKKNEKWLYDLVCAHSSKSAWIKDIIKAHVKNESLRSNNEVRKES